MSRTYRRIHPSKRHQKLAKRKIRRTKILQWKSFSKKRNKKIRKLINSIKRKNKRTIYVINKRKIRGNNGFIRKTKPTKTNKTRKWKTNWIASNINRLN